MSRMVKRVLPGGTLRAIHVFVPALQERFQNDKGQPLMAVRSKDKDGKWTRMRIYRYVRWNGPTELKEDFDNPMPGTGGRGVAILYTAAPLTVYWDADQEEPKTIIVKDKPKAEVHVA